MYNGAWKKYTMGIFLYLTSKHSVHLHVYCPNQGANRYMWFSSIYIYITMKFSAFKFLLILHNYITSHVVICITSGGEKCTMGHGKNIQWGGWYFYLPTYLRHNSRMPGSMLILTWVGIIFVIILHRATLNRAFTVILWIPGDYN
jgi:hypothetical protein